MPEHLRWIFVGFDLGVLFCVVVILLAKLSRPAGAPSRLGDLVRTARRRLR